MQGEAEVKAWIQCLSGKSISNLENDLKTGVVLCDLVNKVRPDTIRQVNNYNSSYRQMQNIDNFLKVCEKLDIQAEDRFKAEDLHYGNNIPKVILTLVLLSQKFGGNPISGVDVESLRDAAANAQKEGGKTRTKDTGLSIFDQTATKNQKETISGAFRTGDKIKKDHGQKAVPTSELGFTESDMKTKQTMISAAKASGTDLIIKSKDGRSSATSELGFIESDMTKKQKMISDAKARGMDNIIRSKDEAVASNELGMIDADRSTKQKMISDAKARGMDNIIRSKDEAVASNELGMIDADRSTKQKMISDAKARGMDNIIRSKDEAVVSTELGMIDADRTTKQKMISDAKARGMDNIIRSKDEAIVTAELGLLDADHAEKQKYLSEANQEKFDKIVKRHDDDDDDGNVNI